MPNNDYDDSSTFFDIPRPAQPPMNPLPNIVDKAYKHSVVDSTKTPVESILAYVGGSNWVVDYYSQFLERSEELKPFDPSQQGVYQVYTKINKLILKLQGALSTDDDRDMGRFQITGQALVTPTANFIPNVGDAFIADVGEGQAGQFTVTEVRRLANNLSSVHEISFKMERDVDKYIEDILESRVTNNLYYVFDNQISGATALLTTEDYNYTQWFKEYQQNLLDMFLSKFYSFEHSTILIPNQAKPTYDQYVTRIYLQLVDGYNSQGRKVREYNCDDYRLQNMESVYDMVFKLKPSLIHSVFRRFGILPTARLKTSVFQNTVRYSDIKFITIPHPRQDYVNNHNSIDGMIDGQALLNINLVGDCTPRPLNGQAGMYAATCCYEPKEEEVKDTEVDISDIGMHVPDIDGKSYALSNAFFDKDIAGMTIFERRIWDVIERKKLNYAHIKAFCDSYPRWTPLQQFYLGPLLILLTQAAIRGM